MSDPGDKYEELMNALAQHRENEDIYRFKIDEINQTRSKIQDEVLALSREYERKLRDLQGKLEKVQTHNEQLSRQNQLYKRDIEGFESRLIEKEKLISVLILQQNSLVTPSEKSKSENNEDNRNQFFNEDDKSFKKPFKPKVVIPVFHHNPHEHEQPHKKAETLSSYDKAEKRREEVVDEIKIKSIESDKEEVTETEVVRRVPPPPPPNTQKFSKTRNPMFKAKKVPVVQKVEYQYMETEPIEAPQQQQEQRQSEQEGEREDGEGEEGREVENEEKEEEQVVESPHELLSEIKKREEENANEEEDRNDFFDQLKQEKTPKNRTKRTVPIGAEDFFSQLGSSNQGETNVMTEIQESSIDYADNSMMSSTTNMLESQHPPMAAPPKRMTKKKPKRERITAVDPDAFD